MKDAQICYVKKLDDRVMDQPKARRRNRAGACLDQS